MRFTARFIAAAVLVGAAFGMGLSQPARAQESVTVHPNPENGVTTTVQPNGGMKIEFPAKNDSNYLNYGPLPDDPGADKSQDYMNQAGGDDLESVGDGMGSDFDADLLPDSDSAP
ncbi:hypothetical protein MWN34_12785 [Ancylobacter sp. 6x-1]|uniref:Uncharacterized protein n=1 Tax=Ancylobacter crimeensis TaxID=2579147 RepID=A0ABT0DCU8_9HYPH|nr:hypothetical protein [Ancylobacter crimeensis]MCK0197786.1 hypothetical protein [Ancylobacter crimeensis]